MVIRGARTTVSRAMAVDSQDRALLHPNELRPRIRRLPRAVGVAMIALGLPVYVFGLVEVAVIDGDARSVATLLAGTAIILLGLVGTDWVLRGRITRTRRIGWREVGFWLFFGVFLAVVGIPISLWIQMSKGESVDFPLTLARELDLPSAAIAGGALGQYFIRRGLNPENSWDRGLLVLTWLVVGFA